MAAGTRTKPCSFGIVGGGWYGCHVAMSLRELGFGVKVFEQHGRLLHEASGNNQFRLHMGFHYARHRDTRIQSRDGFLHFIERYPGLSRSVKYNVYAVPAQDSLIDYDTYCTIMAASGIHFTEGSPSDFPELANISGVICTAEHVLLPTNARAYFEAELEGVLELGRRVSHIQDTGHGAVIDGERFDFAVDATWGHCTSPDIPVVYEPTLLLYYEGPAEFPAITLVDGPLCSIYPTEVPRLFTLSSVRHTPLGQFPTAAEAREVRDDVSTETIAAKRTLMEAQIARYLPDFAKLFRYVSPQLSIKTKPINAHDNRNCHVSRRGSVFSIMSGKIDTVFFATERILALIDADNINMLSHDIPLVSSKVSLRKEGQRL